LERLWKSARRMEPMELKPQRTLKTTTKTKKLAPAGAARKKRA